MSTDTVWRQPQTVCVRRITTVSRPPYITTGQGLFPRRPPHPNPLILRPPFWTPSFIFASCCGFADGQPAVCELQHCALASLFFPPLTLLFVCLLSWDPSKPNKQGEQDNVCPQLLVVDIASIPAQNYQTLLWRKDSFLGGWQFFGSNVMFLWNLKFHYACQSRHNNQVE